MVKFCGFCAASDQRLPPTVSNSSAGTGFRGFSISFLLDAAKHHACDVLECRALRIRLAHQPQALDAGGEEARQRLRIRHAMLLEDLPERGLDAPEAGADACCRSAVEPGKLGGAIADEAAAAAGAGSDVF